MIWRGASFEGGSRGTSISTTRKPVTNLEQKLCYEHLQTVVDVGRFEKHNLKLRHGVADVEGIFGNRERGL